MTFITAKEAKEQATINGNSLIDKYAAPLRKKLKDAIEQEISKGLFRVSYTMNSNEWQYALYTVAEELRNAGYYTSTDPEYKSLTIAWN